MTTHTYEMGHHTLTRIERKYGGIRCRRCGQPIAVGQLVVSKHRGTGRGSSLKLYHEACYDTTLR